MAAPEFIFSEALTASKKAAEEQNAKLGAEGSCGFDCGFAWVVIKPARGSFVAWLKAQKIGDKHYGGGWNIWYSHLHNLSTQSASVHYAAARAFADVLKRHGLAAYANERLN